MFIDREALERKITVISQQAWNRREHTTPTVNNILAYMLLEFGDYILREIEEKLSQKEYEDGEARRVQKPQRNTKS